MEGRGSLLPGSYSRRAVPRDPTSTRVSRGGCKGVRSWCYSSSGGHAPRPLGGHDEEQSSRPIEPSNEGRHPAPVAEPLTGRRDEGLAGSVPFACFERARSREGDEGCQGGCLWACRVSRWVHRRLPRALRCQSSQGDPSVSRHRCERARLAVRDSRKLAPFEWAGWVFDPIRGEGRRLVGDSVFDRVCVAVVGRGHLDRGAGRKARRPRSDPEETTRTLTRTMAEAGRTGCGIHSRRQSRRRGWSGGLRKRFAIDTTNASRTGIAVALHGAVARRV